MEKSEIKQLEEELKKRDEVHLKELIAEGKIKKEEISYIISFQAELRRQKIERKVFERDNGGTKTLCYGSFGKHEQKEFPIIERNGYRLIGKLVEHTADPVEIKKAKQEREEYIQKGYFSMLQFCKPPGYELKCEHCGETIYSKKLLRCYCSYRCRNDAWIARRKRYREQARHKKCLYCGKEFIAKRKDAKYCCNSHRVLRWNNAK